MDTITITFPQGQDNVPTNLMDSEVPNLEEEDNRFRITPHQLQHPHIGKQRMQHCHL